MYNAVECNWESCIFIVLDRQNGSFTMHELCIVIAQSSKIYFGLFVAVVASKARVLTFFPSVIKTVRLRI